MRRDETNFFLVGSQQIVELEIERFDRIGFVGISEGFGGRDESHAMLGGRREGRLGRGEMRVTAAHRMWIIWKR